MKKELPKRRAHLTTTNNKGLFEPEDMRPHPEVKIAIIRAGRTQRSVAQDAMIPEVRLSDIIRGRGAPLTRAEKSRIARALRRPIAFVFPGELIASA